MNDNIGKATKRVFARRVLGMLTDNGNGQQAGRLVLVHQTVVGMVAHPGQVDLVLRQLVVCVVLTAFVHERRIR